MPCCSSTYYATLTPTPTALKHDADREALNPITGVINNNGRPRRKKEGL